MGLPAGRGTKFAGSRAGLLFPEIPGISNVTSTSGPDTILLIGVLPGLLVVNFVVRTNVTSFCDVDWANKLLETSIRMVVIQSGEESFLIFNSLIAASNNLLRIRSTGGRRSASILQQLSRICHPRENMLAVNPCQTRHFDDPFGIVSGERRQPKTGWWIEMSRNCYQKVKLWLLSGPTCGSTSTKQRPFISRRPPSVGRSRLSSVKGCTPPYAAADSASGGNIRCESETASFLPP